MIVTRDPRRPADYALADRAERYRADMRLIVDGEVIGGTYYCPADYIPARRRWASFGPAGLSMRHATRAAAEQAQLAQLAPACTGADDLCGAPAGRPCEPGCPSLATDA